MARRLSDPQRYTLWRMFRRGLAGLPTGDIAANTLRSLMRKGFCTVDVHYMAVLSSKGLEALWQAYEGATDAA